MRHAMVKAVFTIGLVFPLFAGTFFVSAQKSVIDNTAEKIRQFNAHSAFNRGEYKNALTLYKDILKSRPGDGEIAFWVGECYFNMADIEHSLEYFEKAELMNPNASGDLHLELGKTYQLVGNIDKAIVEFEAYKKNNSDSKALKESDVDHYLGQCKVAKEMMANPIRVTVENLGEIVNTEFEDKHPSITADGKKMIFTSRRPRDKDSPVDKEGDGKYFQDIYISIWDSAKKIWGDPQLVAGAVNSDYNDAVCSISPDGKQIFVYRNDPIDARGGDIWVSKLGTTGRWGAPKPMGPPINTTYWEGDACLSPDGNTIYFSSERKVKGSMGRSDIYMSTRASKREEWGEAINLGPEINTEYDEGGVYIAVDGKTLFFCSDGHNSMGSYDIFKSVYENGKWSKAVNLGYPINTIGAEKSFILSTNGKTAYISSDRKGGFGDMDIYKVDLSHYAVLENDPTKADVSESAPGFSILRGTVISNEGASALAAEIKIYNESGQLAGHTSSNAENGGDYFITLPGNKKYTVKIDLKDFKPLSETFLLPSAKDGTTYAEVKHFLMYKK
jgi:tetratricopeptide (TPR) repeat protein